MIKSFKNTGFSLVEVLMSVGILAVGMILIGSVFPAAIHFSTIATERTIATAVADEAFAKVRIFGIDPCEPDYKADLKNLRDDRHADFNDLGDVFPLIKDMNTWEFAYPSNTKEASQKQYFWSALCRLIDKDKRLVQVTVFVSRKPGTGMTYYDPNDGFIDWALRPQTDWPKPVKIKITESTSRTNEIIITNPEEKTFINDGYTIIEDKTGQIYRVLDRYGNNDLTLLLDTNWLAAASTSVWVIPPPVNGGRYPCIGIYQKIISF